MDPTCVMSESGQELERGPGKILRRDELVVAPLISESMLGWTYLRFEREKLLPVIFHESVPSISWFIKTFTENAAIGCFRQAPGKDQADMVGMGWVNSIMEMNGGHRKGEIGMAFFREVKNTLEYGKLMTTWAFENLNVHALFGTTPAPNRAAVLFVRRMGFQMFGPVEAFATWEGKLCSVWISVMTKEKWEERDGGLKREA